MVKYGQDEDAKQQISLAFAESRIGEAPPVTAENLIEAANLSAGDARLRSCRPRISRKRSRPALARSRGHRSGEHLSGARQDQAGGRSAGRRWAPIPPPIRTTTTCWRKAKCTASVIESWNAMLALVPGRSTRRTAMIRRAEWHAGGQRRRRARHRSTELSTRFHHRRTLRRFHHLHTWTGRSSASPTTRTCRRRVREQESCGRPATAITSTTTSPC